MFDTHAPHPSTTALAALALTFTLFGPLDAITTMYGVGTLGATELNPLTHHIITHYGLYAFAVFRLTTAALLPIIWLDTYTSIHNRNDVKQIHLDVLNTLLAALTFGGIALIYHNVSQISLALLA